MNFRRNLLIAVITIGGVSYMGYRIYEARLNATSMRQETHEIATSKVSIIHAKPTVASETITLPGTMVGWYQAPIYARVTGYVKMWYKDYGAEVKKGDLLAEISTPMLNATYRMAKAKVEAAQAQYHLGVVTVNRYVNLRSSHAVSLQSISVKKAEVKTKKAQLNQALQHLANIEARLRFKKVVAPYDGVVIQRNVSVGDFVNAQGSLSLKETAKESNMFTVAQVDKLRLFVNVPESFGPFLQPGLKIDFTVPQFPTRHFSAKFLTVAKGFDSNMRTAVTEFVFDNTDRVLWPGTYTSARITASIGQDMLVIPSSAMVFQEQGSAVVVLTKDNRVHYTPITINRVLDAAFEVSAGISKTDRIVDHPSAVLLEGDKVQVVTHRPGYNSNQPQGAPGSEKQKGQQQKQPEKSIKTENQSEKNLVAK